MIPGHILYLFTGFVMICGVAIGVTAYATSQGSFDNLLVDTQRSMIADRMRDANGQVNPYADPCASCRKVHGAPGPLMGAAGAPLLVAGLGYLWWRRRR